MLRAIWIEVSLVSRDRAAARTGRGEAIVCEIDCGRLISLILFCFGRELATFLSSNGSRANAKAKSFA